MTRSVRVRPEAERDVEAAFAWYEEQRAGLGREFLQELDILYARIAKFPLLYGELYRGLRRARLRHPCAEGFCTGVVRASAEAPATTLCNPRCFPHIQVATLHRAAGRFARTGK